MTPTQRSLAYLREQGYTVAIVERWNPFARIRQDLFGFVDLLAIRKGETLAVQTTSTNVSERIKKIQDSEYLPKITPSGTRHVVQRDGEKKYRTLHHSCHVIMIKDPPVT